jgi:hypothetical protein
VRLIVLLLLLGACSPNSLEDFRYEGEAKSRALASDLKKIHTREELLKAVPVLKKRFNSLVDLMIEALEFQQAHPEEAEMDADIRGHAASDALRVELERIYALEGGRQVIENAEREALLRLDAFERKLAQRNQLIKP